MSCVGSMQGFFFLLGVVLTFFVLLGLVTHLSWKAYRVAEAARRYFVDAGAKVNVLKTMIGGDMSLVVRAEYAGMLWEVCELVLDFGVCIRSPEAIRAYPRPGAGAKPLLGKISTKEDVFTNWTAPIAIVRHWLMRHRYGWKMVGDPSDTSGMGLWRYARGGFERVVLELPPEMSEAISDLNHVAEKNGADLHITVWPDRICYWFSCGRKVPRVESDEGMAEFISAVGRLAQWRWTQAGWALGNR